MQDRFSLKITGESGQGINSIGEIITKSLKNLGYYTFGYREYPSLIRGGVAAYQIDFSDRYLASSNKIVDLMVSISRVSLHEHLFSVGEGGYIIHSIVELNLSDTEQKHIDDNNIKLCYINSAEEALLSGGKKIMSNIVMTGFVWKILDLSLEELQEVVTKKYGKTEELKVGNLKALKSGYEIECDLELKDLSNYHPLNHVKDNYVVSGNLTLSLGAVKAGVRAYYAYPMTPSSSILKHLADFAEETGMIVKQVEDEISAAQMSLGSMYMGTRSMTATSGGGFDLMSETVSLSGMTETPMVLVVAQRPGPATGLPTWTATGDLNIALYAGHGEFPRIVISLNTPQAAYTQIQHALNLAEQYQTVVIVLTDKHLAESIFQVDGLNSDIPIERGLVHGGDIYSASERYAFTETGVSKRWLPGSSEHTYNANSDEHTMDGSITEDASSAEAMMNKRMKKESTIKANLPKPKLHGDRAAQHTIITWGSSINSLLDAYKSLSRDEKLQLNILEYEYIYPLITDPINELDSQNNQFYLVEQNYKGQLGKFIKQETNIDFEEKFLKYNGRPLYLEETIKFMKHILNGA